MELRFLYCLLLFILSLLPFSISSCNNSSDYAILSLAFSSVSNFHPIGCRFPIDELRLSSKNLSGTISWSVLGNLSGLRLLDLSGNSLRGSIPGGFWSSASLLHVDLAGNQLGGALRFNPVRSGSPSSLRFLNLSGNRFTSVVGVKRMGALKVFDVSRNSISGVIPKDLPKLSKLDFLNISYNNFSGTVDSKVLNKFGRSAFIRAGSITFMSSASSPSTPLNHKSNSRNRRKRVIRLGIIISAASIVSILVLLGCVLYVSKCKKNKKKQQGEIEAPPPSEEVGWVAEARWSAPVVVFEKPLMELTFADLAAATSRFGRESQLAEGGGRSGPAYRAVLPGDFHVVVRVVEHARELPESDAAAGFYNLGLLRHPNLLPLLGYCIAGSEKLLLYEYMERGDLHRWLHELPAGKPDVEDWTGDTWEAGEEKRAVGDWPTRHRIALGIARGLAFLHQGWAGSGRAVVHGHLVPTNVLLGDDLEPRIADFGGPDGGTPEDDVYSFGLIVFELVTGRAGWDEEIVGRTRILIREGKTIDLMDSRLGAEEVPSVSELEGEIMECLQVGYLCTAQSPEKRPTMQQVVGLLKDIRPTSSSS
ncbi:calmodulin-binding receptor kinase CaMRLK [Typha angustifolia]|uniref:calmodulin-binding receptor kinase CaMRLK n=1 Tax=Typha angustifolia TaxID=59011 RepID=UPI003C2BEA47